MTKVLMSVVLILALISTKTCLGEEDATAAKILAAKEVNEKETQALADRILKSLKRAEENALKTGNKVLVDKIMDEIEAFESKRALPTVVPIKDYLRGLRKTRETLEEVYMQSVKTSTKMGRLDEASAIEHELNEFRLQVGMNRGSHYIVVKQSLTWHEAAAACEKLGGHLAIIKSADEAEFLVKLVERERVPLAFIGCTDERKEGRWIWVDGSEVGYSFWDLDAGQPNNSTGPRGGNMVEHYAAINRERKGKWWDTPARIGETGGFVCEWD